MGCCIAALLGDGHGSNKEESREEENGGEESGGEEDRKEEGWTKRVGSG